MIKTIREAIADMQTKVVFDAQFHTYKNLANDEWLQGVSSVSSIIPKNWLSAWGAKEAVKFLGYTDYEDFTRALEVLQEIKGFVKPEQLVSLLKFAKGACSRKSKEALADGKAGHKWLEEYIKMRIKLKTAKFTPLLPEGLLERPIKQFLEWEKKNIKEWIASEALVANTEKSYAGTLDGIVLLNNGRYAVTDFKFASHISEDAYLQTAGYLSTFEPYLDVSGWDRIVIRLPKTKMIEHYDQKTRKYSMVENNLEALSVPTPYILDRDTFLHLLPTKKWVNFVTKLNKEKK